MIEKPTVVPGGIDDGAQQAHLLADALGAIAARIDALGAIHPVLRGRLEHGASLRALWMSVHQPARLAAELAAERATKPETETDVP